MELTVTINEDAQTYDSLLVALRALQEFGDHRWSATPRQRTFEVDPSVPASMSMPALYNHEGYLVTTNPVQALLKLIGEKASTRMDGVEVSVVDTEHPETNRIDGYVHGGKVVWTNPPSKFQFMTQPEILQKLDADLQIADHRAARARMERDLTIESFIAGESMTGYKVAKTLKVTQSAITQLRARLRKASDRDVFNDLRGQSQ